MDWTLKLKGGGFAGEYPVELDVDPEPVLIAWRCAGDPDCDGHFSFNPTFHAIELESAVAYKRTELSHAEHLAVYELGDVEPHVDAELEEPVLVGAGVPDAPPDWLAA